MKPDVPSGSKQAVDANLTARVITCFEPQGKKDFREVATPSRSAPRTTAPARMGDLAVPQVGSIATVPAPACGGRADGRGRGAAPSRGAPPYLGSYRVSVELRRTQAGIS